jgi:hypothetical protein
LDAQRNTLVRVASEMIYTRAHEGKAKSYTMEGVTPHDFRHSFVSNQLDAGTPIHVVRNLAGHASIVTTQLYAHSSDEARRAAVDRVRLGAQMDPFELARGAQRGTQGGIRGESERKSPRIPGAWGWVMKDSNLQPMD